MSHAAACPPGGAYALQPIAPTANPCRAGTCASRRAGALLGLPASLAAALCCAVSALCCAARPAAVACQPACLAACRAALRCAVLLRRAASSLLCLCCAAQSVSGSLQSLCWMSSAVGGITSAYFSGSLVQVRAGAAEGGGRGGGCSMRGAAAARWCRCVCFEGGGSEKYDRKWRCPKPAAVWGALPRFGMAPWRRFVWMCGRGEGGRACVHVRMGVSHASSALKCMCRRVSVFKAFCSVAVVVASGAM